MGTDLLLAITSTTNELFEGTKIDDDDDDDGRINFSMALSPKTTRTRNNKPKQ